MPAPSPTTIRCVREKFPTASSRPAARCGTAQSIPLDQALVNGMLGIPGYGGNLAQLAPEHQARCRVANVFYKQHRASLARSVARCLTPIQLVEARRGWVAFQLTDEQTDTHFFHVFRFYDNLNDTLIRPLGLSPQKRYTLVRAFHRGRRNPGGIPPRLRVAGPRLVAGVRWHGGAIWMLSAAG